MSVLQLIESIPVETELGPGQAIIFETGEHDNHWTIVLETRAIVTFPQSAIRVARGFYTSRGISTEKMKEIVRDK